MSLASYRLTGSNNHNKQASVDWGNAVLATINIGLFSEASGATVPTAVEIVRTSGYSTDGIGAAEYIYDASVNSGTVASNPRTQFITANGRGFKLSPYQKVVTPQMFGALANSSSNDTEALQAFGDFWIDNNCKAVMAGTYYLDPDEVVWDGSHLTDNLRPATMMLDWGAASFYALSGGDRLLSITSLQMTRFVGRPTFRGIAYTSNTYTAWTVQTAIYLDNCARCTFDGANIEGFALYGFELESTPNSNNAIQLGHVTSKRVGSGDDGVATRSLTANWSGATRSGSYSSASQYTTITVDTLPPVYVTGAGPGIPERRFQVEIAGRLHDVIYVDRSASTLRVFPWIQTATGTSGTLRYHMGATVLFIGNDANICGFKQVSALIGGCAVEFHSLYGGDFGQIHAESCGSAIKIAAATDTQLNGATIASLYCETSNVFNIVWAGRATGHVKILTRHGSSDASKDQQLHAVLTAAETYQQEGVIGGTVSATEGWHFRRKRFVDGENESLDFSRPATFTCPTYRTRSGTDALTLTLVAPSAGLRNLYSYDAATVFVLGRGASGEPAGGVTFTPPSGHTINGGAASASATFSGLTAPGMFIIHFDGSTAWTVRSK